MKIFITGATGYIGGSVAADLVARGHAVSGLVRSDAGAAAVAKLGIEPVSGTLDDTGVLAGAARAADAVIDTASADHGASTQALIAALSGSGKTYIRTSGSSIVGNRAAGELRGEIFSEDTPFRPSPGRAARVALDNMVRAAPGVRSVVICPSLIYGRSRGPHLHSIQLPWLISVAKKYGVARHIGPGANRWSNVHIDDVVALYALALEKAPTGAFYFAENGENSTRELCEAISRMLGFGGRTEPMTIAQASAEWGEGAAQDSMGSNSRVRAVRARNELGWAPSGRSIIEEIERGCYARAD
jgi:nucleoside-diphosphate-sugar epimerase